MLLILTINLLLPTPLRRNLSPKLKPVKESHSTVTKSCMYLLIFFLNVSHEGLRLLFRYFI